MAYKEVELDDDTKPVNIRDEYKRMDALAEKARMAAHHDKELRPRKYSELALRTESIDLMEVADRVHDKEFIGQLLVVMQDLAETSETLDRLKKHAFYGKPYEMPYKYDAHRFKDIAERCGQSTFIGRTRTLNSLRLLHGVMGMATEAGEMIEQMNSFLFSGKELDLANIREELGDESWYMNLVMDASDAIARANSMGGDLFSWESVWKTNIEKLELRYKKGTDIKFTSEKAINRDLDKEREILES